MPSEKEEENETAVIVIDTELFKVMHHLLSY